MKQPSITTLPPSPEEDRHSRMKKYFIAMIIRVICLLCLLITDGWWMVLPIIGSIVIPYFAMLIANESGTPRGQAVESPGGLLPAAAFPQPVTPPETAEPASPADAESADTEQSDAAWIIHEQREDPHPGTTRSGDTWVVPESRDGENTP